MKQLIATPESSTGRTEGLVPERRLPEMWVGTTDDYAHDQRYGRWIDASQRTADVVREIRTTVDGTPHALGKRWSVCDVRGFSGWQPAPHEGLREVLAIARGISIHGPAYGALAARLGSDSIALRLDKYPQSYLGQWDSLNAFVTTVAGESGWFERINSLPPTMRPFVRLDMDALADVARRDLTIIEHAAGVWVYDPRLW